MLNQENPKDYILASGVSHSIKDFVERAFQCADLAGSWVENDGDPLSTKYVLNLHDYKVAVRVNEQYYRPAEVKSLTGDASLAITELGWNPKVTFDMLVEKMVKWDLDEERDT